MRASVPQQPCRSFVAAVNTFAFHVVVKRHRRKQDFSRTRRVSTAQKQRTGVGGANGIQIALAQMQRITTAKFDQPECEEFLENLADARGISVDALKGAIHTIAQAAVDNNYIYDGVSSNDKIDSIRFPGYSASTIGNLFNMPSQLALSQVNGAAIWIRSSQWEPGTFGQSEYQRTNYGVGTLLHEILHKALTGGGKPI